MPDRPTTRPPGPNANHTHVVPATNVVPIGRLIRLPGVIRDHDTTWMADASCRGAEVDLWFPTRGDTRSTQSTIRQAKAVCAHCPVRQDCLDHAIDNHEEHGIWGGMGEKERRRYARTRSTPA